MNFRKFHTRSEVNIFTEIGKLASEFDAVNLSQGSPDYDLNPELKQFLIDGIHTDLTKYASTSIIPELEESLLKFVGKRPIPLHVKSSEIAVSIGATYSLYVSLATFLEAGDEVIVLEPCYETYEPAIELEMLFRFMFLLMKILSLTGKKSRMQLRTKLLRSSSIHRIIQQESFGKKRIGISFGISSKTPILSSFQTKCIR